MKDLRERFAKVDIQASKPIVPFRETAIKVADLAPPKTPNAPRGTIHGSSAHSVVNFTIHASPLPSPILGFIQDNLLVLKKILRERKLKEQYTSSDVSATQEEDDDDLEEG